MNTHETLVREISAMQFARDSLPSDVFVRTLFDLVVMRLSDHAEAIRRHMNDLDRDRTSVRGDVGDSRSFSLGIISDLSFSRRNDGMDVSRA